MELAKKVDQDMIAAMKAHDVERTSTLRMMKAALKNRQIEKRSELTDAEGQQVLTTMIKQRKDSIEQFQKGNRQELAAKEAREILLIENYMPKTASEEDMKKLVDEALEGSSLGPKDMGQAMKAVQAKVQAAGVRADGKMLSDLVRQRLGEQPTGNGN